VLGFAGARQIAERGEGHTDRPVHGGVTGLGHDTGLGQRAALEAQLQLGRGGGQQLVGCVVTELDRPLLDRPVGQDHDQQGQAWAEPDELDRSDGRRFVGGPDDHGGVGSEVRQQPRGALEHLLHLTVDWSKKRLTFWRWAGPSTPGSVRWSTKNR